MYLEIEVLPALIGQDNGFEWRRFTTTLRGFVAESGTLHAARVNERRERASDESVKRLAILLIFTASTTHAEDKVYLKKISGSAGPERYELLAHRPLVRGSDTIEVPTHEVEGLCNVNEIRRGGRTLYVLKNSPWSRYEVRSIAPGVSYMQSIGGGGGFQTGRRIQKRPLESPPSGARPFGWPAYDNPLGRPAFR